MFLNGPALWRCRVGKRMSSTFEPVSSQARTGDEKKTPNSKGVMLAKVLSRLGLKALRWALPRLSLSERMATLREVQGRTLKTLDGSDGSTLRHYAVNTLDHCLRRVEASEQPKIITEAARTG